MSRTVHLLSLGCPKNLVDAEVMLGVLQRQGYTVVEEPERAEVIVVNTCSFIEPAKKESVDAILEAARFKEEGRCEKLVVAGCLSQRYPKELAASLPEVDHFLGTGEYQHIAEILASSERVAVGIPRYLADHEMPRVKSTGPSAYLKVSEGCSNPCTFCIIPKLRGKHRSRTVASLVAEATALARDGVVELNLIAQDLTDYGSDLRDGTGLAHALDALEEVPGLRWIRLLYAYPRLLPDALFDRLARGGKVLPYLDIPVQHSSERMLTRMKRHHDRAFTRELLHELRRRVPGITLRTSLIVGFPGELEEDYQDLRDFVAEVKFERLGVFPYSHEEGTVAYEMDGRLPKKVIERRRRGIMAVQRKISRAANKALVGEVVLALVEGPSEESDLLLQARMASQAPGGIDGYAYINDGWARPGTIVRLEVTQAGDYDVVGRIVEVVAEPPVREPPRRTVLPVISA
jgi:ribosomal protein S12 methylthiotransferase